MRQSTTPYKKFHNQAWKIVVFPWRLATSTIKRLQALNFVARCSHPCRAGVFPKSSHDPFSHRGSEFDVYDVTQRRWTFLRQRTLDVVAFSPAVSSTSPRTECGILLRWKAQQGNIRSNHKSLVFVWRVGSRSLVLSPFSSRLCNEMTKMNQSRRPKCFFAHEVIVNWCVIRHMMFGRLHRPAYDGTQEDCAIRLHISPVVR